MRTYASMLVPALLTMIGYSCYAADDNGQVAQTVTGHHHYEIAAGTYGNATLMSGVAGPAGTRSPVLLSLTTVIVPGKKDGAVAPIGKDIRLIGEGVISVETDRLVITLEKASMGFEDGEVVSAIAAGYVTDKTRAIAGAVGQEHYDPKAVIAAVDQTPKTFRAIAPLLEVDGNQVVTVIFTQPVIFDDQAVKR